MLWVTTRKREITKWEGALLLVLYGFFIVKLFI
jgi:Ca2+/Na+ antiporter